jgi:hypothetical protein
MIIPDANCFVAFKYAGEDEHSAFAKYAGLFSINGSANTGSPSTNGIIVLKGAVVDLHIGTFDMNSSAL